MKKREEIGNLLNLKKKLLTYSILFGLGTTALTGCSAKVDGDKVETIKEYYGDGSLEYELMSYIDLAKELHKLHLDKYCLDDPNEDITLDTVDTITAKIALYNETKNIDLLPYLKRQEIALAKYIVTKGYSIYKNDSTDLIKSYLTDEYDLNGYFEIEIPDVHNRPIYFNKIIVVTYEIPEYLKGIVNINPNDYKVTTSYDRNKIDKDVNKVIEDLDTFTFRVSNPTNEELFADPYNTDRYEYIVNGLNEVIEVEEKMKESKKVLN